MMKFSDMPVSQYTGTADVTVPIYTIQANGLSVPVSLSYHTGGIRLKEESGWVGLGWALNAGGCISRSIMDKDDFDGTGYFTSSIPEIKSDLIGHPNYGVTLTPYAYDFFCNYLVYTTAGNLDFSQAFINSSPYADLEPDVYSYNFLGKSGKFIISRDKKVILQKQDNLKITFDNQGLSFYIVDDQGNRYLFNDRELVQNNNGLPSSGSTSSWYLSQVITQLNDTIRFNYTSDNSWTNLDGDINQSYRNGCANNEGLTSSQNPTTSYWNITLSSIDYATGQVQFSFDNSRVDLTNGKKLNGITIYSKVGATLNYFKEEQLFYSYFNNGYAGTDKEFKRLRLDSVKEVSAANALPAYAFSYFDPLSGSVPNTGKHSFSVDHWGFFNGGANSMLVPSFAGVTKLYSGQYLNLAGANREPDSSYMKIFSLYQVKYPTGGSTVFQYEPNFYDEKNSINGQPDFPQTNLIDTSVTIVMNTRGQTSGTIDMSNIFPIGLAGNASYTVTFRTTSNNGCSVYRNTTGKIYFTLDGTTTDINNSNLTCDPNTPTCLSPTLYLNIFSANSHPAWTAYIDNSIGSDFVEIRVTVHWQELRSLHYNNPTIMGSGLRIKSIADYSASGTLVKKRIWDYTYQEDRDNNGVPETYSTGRLMAYPSYVRYEPMIITDGSGNKQTCTSLTRFSGSNTTLSSVIAGNIVGYDQVTESIVDYSSGADLGKTVYRFFNTSDTLYSYAGYRLPGVLNMGNNLNGSLLSKTVYARKNSTYYRVSATTYGYHTTNRIVYYSMKYNYLPPIGSAGAYSSYCGGYSVTFEFLSSIYPSIKSEKVLTDSVTQVSFDQNDTSKSLSMTTYSYYDNPIHFQLTRSSRLDSRGNRHVTLLRYPQDYLGTGQGWTGNTVMDSLISRNMVATVIEKRDSLYYNGPGGGYIEGAQLSLYQQLGQNALGLGSQYKLDMTTPISDFQPFSFTNNTISKDSRYRQMISYDSYTNHGNLAQFTGVDQAPVSFIWDYNYTYPIAQVNNSTVGMIAYTSFEADGIGNWTILDTSRVTEGLTGKRSFFLNTGNNISFNTSSSGVDLIVSYWSRSGQVTISGATLVSAGTGLSKNGWTYYEHRIRTAGSSIVLTGSGILLDELRLYPTNAKMTTYTYDPFVGMTSQCSAQNLVFYYNYDLFGRLQFIRDFDGNIIKSFEYNYKQ